MKGRIKLWQKEGRKEMKITGIREEDKNRMIKGRIANRGRNYLGRK